MARPSVTDDEEEATKVEPAETALHAAASKDDDEVTTALSAQASVERERALRKSLPPSLDLPLPGYGGGGDSEFEDPEDDDGISLSTETPGAILRSTTTPTAIPAVTPPIRKNRFVGARRAVLAPRRPTAALGSSIPGIPGDPSELRRRSAGSPVASPARTPSAPRASRRPAPASVFRCRAPRRRLPRRTRRSRRAWRRRDRRTARRATSSAPMPALQIPAPLRRRRHDDRHQLRLLHPKRPDAGAAAAALFVVAGFITGMVTGVKVGRRGPVTVATAQPTAPPAPVVIQPVPSPPAPVAAGDHR